MADRYADWLFVKLADASAAFAVLRQEPSFTSVEFDELVMLAAAATGRCSRCRRVIKDFAPPEGGMTAGYYTAAGWSAFVNPGEIFVCDACMWADPRYIAVYGSRPAPEGEPQ